WRDGAWWTAAALTVGLIVYLGLDMRHTERSFRPGEHNVLTERSFYGVLHVSDPDDPTDDLAARTLANGTIDHGEQFLDPKKHMQPGTYYGPDTGVARAIREAQARGPVRVGVIGLGAGTLACFGRRGDWFRFYDINPQVVQVANTEFTFLRDCRAAHDVVLGDARLSLEREPPQGFDVLVVDAFSGDSIPIHLLTREAFALYFRHLRPGGVLAVHVTNLFLDLAPVVAQSAQAVGKEAWLVETPEDDSANLFPTEWALVTGRDGFWQGPLVKDAVEAIPARRGLRLWTDDYSNLFQILKRD
ncbi:MAG: fused MFS/spermidine synthase, partial [Armatimonadetes bacterium]|nr:fused MFS/spermidine synthase [Armatimonadota bacterium]